jgi:hypothetical protein
MDKHESAETASENNNSDADHDKNGSSSDAVYKIGHGHTPIHTRFAPGTSGNSRGRPRGSSKNKVAQALQRTLSLKCGDLREAASSETSIWEALVRSLARDGLKGKVDSARLLLQALESIANLAHRG